jgi:hypothetical protein
MSWELVAPILRLKDTKRRTLDIARATGVFIQTRNTQSPLLGGI